MKTKKILASLLIFILAFTLIPVNVMRVDAAKKVVKIKKVTLNKTVCTLKKGDKLKLKATLTPKNTTQNKLVWSSSNKKIATVSTSGVVKAVKNGKATITVKIKGTSKKATCKITVGTPVTKVSLSMTKAILDVGKSLQLQATVSPKSATTKGITYASSNSSVATVSSNGKVTAKKAGKTTITATAKDGSGKKAVCTMTVVKPVVKVTSVAFRENVKELEVGESYQISATVLPVNATNKALEYTTDNAEVATVDDNGKVQAVAAGTATITATAKDGSGKKAVCTVTVVKPVVKVTSVAFEDNTRELEIGESCQLNAIVLPIDATNKALEYTTDNAEVVTVDDNGNVQAVAAGTATITATAKDGSGKKAVCTITVKELNDLRVVAVSSTDGSVTGYEIYDESIIIYGTSIRLRKDVLQFAYTSDDVSSRIFFDDEWAEWYLEITNDSGESKEYRLDYCIDRTKYGELKVTGVSSNDGSVTQYEIYEDSIDIYGTSVRLMKDVLEFSYASEGVNSQIYSDAGYWYLRLTNEMGNVREYELYYCFDYEIDVNAKYGNLKVTGVFSNNGSVTDYDTTFPDIIKIYGTVREFSDIKDVLEFRYAMEGVTSEINCIEGSWYLKIKSDLGNTREYVLIYIFESDTEYGDLEVTSISSTNGSMTSYEIGEEYIWIHGTAKGFEDIKDTLKFGYAMEEVVGEIYCMEDEWYLKITDASDNSREYEILYYQDYNPDAQYGDLKVTGVSTVNGVFVDYEIWDNNQLCIFSTAKAFLDIKDVIEFSYGSSEITGEIYCNGPESGDNWALKITNTAGKSRTYKICFRHITLYP